MRNVGGGGGGGPLIIAWYADLGILRFRIWNAASGNTGTSSEYEHISYHTSCRVQQQYIPTLFFTSSIKYHLDAGRSIPYHY